MSPYSRLSSTSTNSKGQIPLIISEIWRPEVRSRWRLSRKSCLFGKKTPCGKIFKICFRKDSSWHRSTSCVYISWNLADRTSVKSCVIYLTKKISSRSPALASARIAPKICQGQLQTICSESPKFHPNRFTSGGVIAGRANTVETHHRVFPILCFSPSKSLSWLFILRDVRRKESVLLTLY